MGYQSAPQYTAEQQDAQSLGGTAGAGSIVTGVGFSTTVAAASNGVSLTTLAAGTALSVAAIGGPLSANFFALGTQTIDIATSGGVAVLSYTGKTGTPGSAGTITGIAIVSGTGSWTVATGGGVWEQPLTIPDIIGPGASIGRGDGGSLGVNDWATVLCNTENDLAGLIPQGPGLVLPVYSDSVYGGLQWATNSGAGVSTVTTGSPSVTANAGSGGALASSVLLGSTGAVAGDTRSFRRLFLFFQKQANGATVTIATTGVVKSSGAISTAGSGLAVWDSGDVGYQSAATGFTATAGTVAGSGATSAGVVLVGALYLQSAGVNGVINVNVCKGGTYTGDWSTTMTGLQAFIQLLVTMGMPPRRFITGDEISNDQLNGVAVGTAITNLGTISTALNTASPLTQLVQIAPYGLGTVALPGVGEPTYANVWVPAIKNAAIVAGAFFVDMYAAFGDVSAASGDPYGYTIDNLHFSLNPTTSSAGLVSKSGRNGQETIAEFFVDQLTTSKDYAVSGTTQSGTAVDGKVTTLVGQGLSGVQTGPVTSWFKNASDTQASLILGTPASQLGIPGVLAGPGGSTATDTILVRTGGGVWTTGVAATQGIKMGGLALGNVAFPATAGAKASVPPSSATIQTALGNVALGTSFHNTRTHDVRAIVYLAITVNTSLVVSLGVGSATGPAQSTIITGTTALGIVPITFLIPASYFALLSTSGTGTAAIVGQYLEAN